MADCASGRGVSSAPALFIFYFVPVRVSSPLMSRCKLRRNRNFIFIALHYREKEKHHEGN